MILAALATRAVRLTHLGRTSPGVPASAEFTPYEIDAAFILTKRKRDRRKQSLHRVDDGDPLALGRRAGAEDRAAMAVRAADRPPGAPSAGAMSGGGLSGR